MKRRTRRLGRILFNTLTAISLLLAIATAGLWCFLPRVGDGGTSLLKFDPFDNRFNFAWLSHAPNSRRYDLPGVTVFISQEERGYVTDLSAGWSHASISIFWPLSIVALLEGLGIIALLQSHRQAGHCPGCGYDLRANPAKCSECGHEAAAVA